MLRLEEGRLRVLGRGWGGGCWGGCVPLGKARPATLRLLLQAGKLRPKDPLPTAGVRGFAGGQRDFLGHQPIRAKPVPRHRGVPAHTEGPLGPGYLEGRVSAQQWTVRAGPGASQLRPSLPQSHLRHVSTHLRWAWAPQPALPGVGARSEDHDRAEAR